MPVGQCLFRVRLRGKVWVSFRFRVKVRVKVRVRVRWDGACLVLG